MILFFVNFKFMAKDFRPFKINPSKFPAPSPADMPKKIQTPPGILHPTPTSIYITARTLEIAR